MDFALILDIVVIVVLLISCVISFLRGFVREILTIFGLFGAAMTALIAGPKLSPGIEKWLLGDLPADTEEKLWGVVPYDLAAPVIAYAGLFVVTLILLSVISHYIAKSVHALGLGPVDRSLGVIFGLARGVLLIGLLYLPFHILMVEEDKEEWFATSHSYSYVEYTSAFLLNLMPESWKRDAEEDSTEEPADPLKDLTGENDEPVDNSGNQNNNNQSIERQAMDVLIQNQEAITDMIMNNNRQPNAEPANE
jgi:membrane protein required for colicin V production